MLKRAHAWLPVTRIFLGAAVWALLGAVPIAGAGMLDTPAPIFSDGKAAQIVGFVSTVIKNNAVETVIICTNLAAVPLNIGFEVFDKTGALSNSVGAGNGAILNVPVGATVSLATGVTKILTEDAILTLPPGVIRNASGRIVASAPGVSCIALLADELHAIDRMLDPNLPAIPAPSLAPVEVLSCGDGSCSPGVGESCESCPVDCGSCTHLCGDTTADALVDANDVPALRSALSDPLLSPLSATGQSRCSIIGTPHDCDVRDLVVLRRFLALPSLPPGLAPACEPIRYK